MHGKVFILGNSSRTDIMEELIACVVGADAVKREDDWAFRKSLEWLSEYYEIDYFSNGPAATVDTWEFISGIEMRKREKIQKAIQALEENDPYKARLILTPDIYFVFCNRIYDEFSIVEEPEILTHPCLVIQGSYDYHR
ncbi:MAG: hypothetical protein QW334_03030 [Thermofilum sp.]